MKVYISIHDNKIFTSEQIVIDCYSEYCYSKNRPYELIPSYQINNEIETRKVVDNLLLIPNTHINNLWHLMHHLFALFKFITLNNIKPDNAFFIFFLDFYERQGDILKTTYDDFIFTCFGFNKADFLDTYNAFKDNNCIEVKNLQIVSTDVNFANEPLFNSFKLSVLQNFNLSYTLNNKPNITFILRRCNRKILNIEEIQNYLSCININYIFLEDYSNKEQLNIVSNTDILIGVHGAGLTWSVFMKQKSLLIEMYPGNSDTDNYIRWCNIADIRYKRMVVSIKEGDVGDFRNCNVSLTASEIIELKSLLV